MGVMGATSAGSLTNLIAVGAMDTHLTLCPKITFWRFRYNRYTNFTMESIEQQFNSPVGFGADVTATMNRNGDLMYFMYAVLTLPGICANVPAVSVGPPAIYPVQGAGARPCATVLSRTRATVCLDRCLPPWDPISRPAVPRCSTGSLLSPRPR
jgi:hypothetical protein